MQFPLLSKINTNGVRLFTNELNDEIIFIDKTGLEDAINFQKIEFEVIDGYYYDEGHNENINKIIKHLYLKRKR